MSAAAPPSYPTNGGQPSNHRPSSSSSVNGGERVYEHIQDLRRKSQAGFHPHGSVYQLLEDAKLALNQAETLMKFRRPDMSYVEYLRASEIVVEVIPRNKGWPELQMDHSGGGMQKYHLLQKRINAASEQYANLKEIIINNNRRSGVQPAQSDGGSHVTTEPAPQVNGNSLSGAMGAIKIKPSPSPKPESLHGRALSSTSPANGAPGPSAPPDPLKDRLAALRNASGNIDTSRPDSRGSNSSSIHGSPVSIPSADGYGNRSSLDALSRLSSGPGPRPLGPRGMPNANAGPPLPGKLPLDTNISAAMPQEPKATYSPARNMQTAGNIELPRHTPRSLASTSARKSSLGPTSSASSHAPNGIHQSETGDYFPSYTPPANGAPPPAVSRRKSVHVPKETRISAERLYDYLERFNILLIDFRPRQDFDLGHIYARNVICIDPLHMSQGMSAEQLLERMVISPDVEQEMFMNRDKFDLVVYYDTQTQSETFLQRPMGELQTKLKYLHEALYDFNQDKPLQRPPILLIGGIDAWADLVGNQALITSDTAAKAKQGRPIQRRPAPGPSQLRNPKRRLRDYNPLDDEEERRWRERARAESVVLPTPPALVGEEGEVIPEGNEAEEEEPNSAIDRFNERFPEAGQLERYAFSTLQPSRSPPQPPPKVPMYPAPPPVPASYPSVPARPAPAAPRMSYTGVSDRAVSQTAPLTRTSSLTPYIPNKYLAANLRLPRTGLDNFRFTCYMNATLQALSGTLPLSIYFFEDAYTRTLQTDNWKGTKGVMSQLYSNLIKSLWKDDVSYIRPSTFRNFCGRLNKEWGRDDQEQDAKEFFDFLIDCLHEDTNWKWSRTPLRELTKFEEAKREKMPKSVVAKVEWDRFTHRDQSFITSLFGGQYSSRLFFSGCGHTSTKHDAFYALSVEIPDVRGRNPTLDDCLRSYCVEEELTGEDRPKCDQCDERRDATKQIMLTRAPQFLVVHFKRFRTSGRYTKKIEAPIDFPIENFDLEPYMLRQPSPSETESIAQQHGPEYLKQDPGMTPPYKYDAYAVIRHIGTTIQSGHYTALIKDRARGIWRCFNDRSHEEFVPGQGRFRGSNDVRNGQAYIVFFQRVLPSQLGPGGVNKI